MNKRAVFDTVCDAIDAVKSSFQLYRKLGISDREEIIQELRKELLNHVDELAQKSYEETCMGNVVSKIEKIKLSIERTPGTEDLVSEVLTKDKVMTLYEYSAFGIACAIMPSTNPVATVINNVIGLLASGNAVILCPHPRAIEVTKYLTDIIATTILRTSGIDNLVTTLSEVSIKNISEIMHHPDVNLLVVTGGSDIARVANKCDKKVISAGAANPTFIVDETADLDKAASCIVKGASFDNNILCVTEKNIVIVESVYDKFKKALEKEGVFYVDTVEDMLKLSKVLLTEDLKPNKFLGGKDVKEILKFAGIESNGVYKIIAVDVPKIHPFATEELLMPVIAIVKAKNFDDALETSLNLEQGLHHTAGIYSNIIERLNIAAKQMQTSIFVKNGCSLEGIGFSDNNPVSFTIANKTGEGSTSARNFARKRRCALVDAFSIRWWSMKDLINKTEIVFQGKALSKLKEIEEKRILIITDSFIAKSVLMNKVLRSINASNKVVIYDKVLPDPSLEIIGQALSLYIKEDIDIIIGFGGGSSIDSAKGVIYFAKEVTNKDVYFIAIPTTSGTGSEVTSVSVIKDNDTQVKHLLQSYDMLPDLAILDTCLVKELPKKIIANTGIDVLTHAIEAYVGKNRSSYSDALAEKAGELVVKYLYRSYRNMNDIESKEEMHLASMMAGMAFEMAGLGINHAIAHQIGAKLRIPHGLCNGILLTSVIGFNSKVEAMKKRYANYARKIGVTTAKDDTEAVNNLNKFIEVLQAIMDMPKSLSECNVSREKLLETKNQIAENALKDNCMKTSVNSISIDEIKEIIEKIY